MADAPTVVCPDCKETWYDEDTDGDDLIRTAYDAMDDVGVPDPPADTLAHAIVPAALALTEYIEVRNGVGDLPEHQTVAARCVQCSIYGFWIDDIDPAWMIAVSMPLDSDDWGDTHEPHTGEKIDE